MTSGDTVDAAEAASLVAAAIDAGITVIDTANGYAGGASEEILGSILHILSTIWRPTWRNWTSSTR